MRNQLFAFLLLTVVALATPPAPYPGRVEVRGRQHFAVRGQPLRNWARWWFGSVPVPAKPVQQ